ncbi:MAG: phosphoribosylformylglycinamidine synthase I [Planctomycetota bacterium]|nr:MAG: phosphoribosylformylglycinamidine synthase I [Planctomycetota bacterium]
MPTPRVLVLRAPGANCDQETAFAFERAGATAECVHVNRWLESPRLADGYQVLCLPGGFSYGDDLGSGRILGNQLRRHLSDSLGTFREQGKLILGICNGFQILVKSGLLDTDDSAGPGATLAWNASGRFIDRWVQLRVASDRSPFLRGIQRMFLPIAHAEGRFVGRDEPTLERWERSGQLVLRYCESSACKSQPFNPNGAMRDVAGMCDASGRVLGLMPHPERFIDRTQHPQWTRLPAFDEGDGMQVFRNAVEYFA